MAAAGAVTAGAHQESMENHMTAHNGMRSPGVGYVVREKSRVVAGVSASARWDLVPGHG